MVSIFIPSTRPVSIIEFNFDDSTENDDSNQWRTCHACFSIYVYDPGVDASCYSYTFLFFFFFLLLLLFLYFYFCCWIFLVAVCWIRTSRNSSHSGFFLLQFMKIAHSCQPQSRHGNKSKNSFPQIIVYIIFFSPFRISAFLCQFFARKMYTYIFHFYFVPHKNVCLRCDALFFCIYIFFMIWRLQSEHRDRHRRRFRSAHNMEETKFMGKPSNESHLSQVYWTEDSKHGFVMLLCRRRHRWRRRWFLCAFVPRQITYRVRCRWFPFPFSLRFFPTLNDLNACVARREQIKWSSRSHTDTHNIQIPSVHSQYIKIKSFIYVFRFR